MFNARLWIAFFVCLVISGAASASPLDFTYTYSPASGTVYAPYPSYPDSTGTELNDGVYGDANYGGGGTTYTDPAWVGTLGDQNRIKPQVNADFGVTTKFDTLTVNYFSFTAAGIFPVFSANVIISDDDVFNETPLTFTTFVNTPDEAVLQTTLDLGGAVGRYVQVSFFTDPAENAHVPFTFLSELDFVGSVVPEPASFSLLTLGGLLVLRRRNR